MNTIKEILIEAAPAKINYYLNIIGKRKDGYHEMEMVNHSADLYDRLTLISGEESFSLQSNFETPDNLITKVVETMSARYHKPVDFKIILEKRIPHQAGLGGGSADAAAVIRLLDRYWELELDEIEKCSLALEFGADVPYCLYNIPARVTGIGEKIVPLDVKFPPYLIIMKPSVNIETKAAFDWVDQTEEKERGVQNSFYPVVAERYPEIRVYRDKLETLGAEPAVMSGSGSTLIGYFTNKNTRDQAFEALSELEDVSLFKANTLNY